MESSIKIMDEVAQQFIDSSNWKQTLKSDGLYSREELLLEDQMSHSKQSGYTRTFYQFTNEHQDELIIYISSIKGGKYLPSIQNYNSNLGSYIFYVERAMKNLIERGKKFRTTGIYYNNNKEKNNMYHKTPQEYYNALREWSLLIQKFLIEYEKIPNGNLLSTTDWIIPEEYGSYGTDKRYQYYFYRKYPKLMDLLIEDQQIIVPDQDHKKNILARGKAETYITIFKLQEHLKEGKITQEEYEHKLDRWVLKDYLIEAEDLFEKIPANEINEYKISDEVWQQERLSANRRTFYTSY